MTLAMFPGEMINAARSAIIAADAMRALRDGTGDADWSQLDAIQNGLRGAKTGCIRAISEGQKSPVAAETFMADMGGPATLAAFGAAMLGIEAKAQAWNALLSAWIKAMAVTDMVKLDVDLGTNTKFINRRLPILAATVAPLRASTELADLITAFEAVGA